MESGHPTQSLTPSRSAPATVCPTHRRPLLPMARSSRTTAARSSPWAATRTFTLSASASADPAVFGNAITFTADLASSISGPTPTGTVTFTAYAGANNALNYDTTPMTLGTATVENGVATLSLSPSQSAALLLSAHYHVTANFSGDSNYSSGVATFVLPVLETATTSVSASANLVAPGNGVTLTATVTPNGTPDTVVENGSGSSSYWVPTGTVTFMDGSTVLGTVTLNPLEDGTYSSTYLQQVTLLVPSLPTGTNSITAAYSGDQNFANGISTTLPVYVMGMTNPGTQNGAAGDNVSLQIQASSLPPGDTWTYAASGLPAGLSIISSSGLDHRHDHRHWQPVFGHSHRQRQPGRQRQSELHLERVHPVGDQSRDAQRRGWRFSVALQIQASGLAQRRLVDLFGHRLAVGPLHQHQLGPDRRHDHWLGECLLGFGHGQRRPGRQRQPELHLERVHPVGD